MKSNLLKTSLRNITLGVWLASLAATPAFADKKPEEAKDPIRKIIPKKEQAQPARKKQITPKKEQAQPARKGREIKPRRPIEKPKQVRPTPAQPRQVKPDPRQVKPDPRQVKPDPRRARPMPSKGKAPFDPSDAKPAIPRRSTPAKPQRHGRRVIRPDLPKLPKPTACCPGFKCLTSNWEHDGRSNYTFTMQTNQISACIHQLQAYINYLNALNPNITGMALTWTLRKSSSTGGTFTPPGTVVPSGTFTGQIHANQNGLVGTPAFSGLASGYAYRLTVQSTMLTSNSTTPNINFSGKCSKSAQSHYYWNQSRMLIDGKPSPARKIIRKATKK